MWVGAASTGRGHHAQHHRAPPSRRASADVGAIEYIGAPVLNTKIDVERTSRQLSKLRDDVDDLLARLADS